MRHTHCTRIGNSDEGMQTAPRLRRFSTGVARLRAEVRRRARQPLSWYVWRLAPRRRLSSSEASGSARRTSPRRPAREDERDTHTEGERVSIKAGRSRFTLSRRQRNVRQRDERQRRHIAEDDRLRRRGGDAKISAFALRAERASPDPRFQSCEISPSDGPSRCVPQSPSAGRCACC